MKVNKINECLLNRRIDKIVDTPINCKRNWSLLNISDTLKVKDYKKKKTQYYFNHKPIVKNKSSIDYSCRFLKAFVYKIK